MKHPIPDVRIPMKLPTRIAELIECAVQSDLQSVRMRDCRAFDKSAWANAIQYFAKWWTLCIQAL